MPGHAGGQDTIKHIHAQADADHQVFRRADAQQVARLQAWQRGRGGAQHLPHHRLWLAHREAANRETGEGQGADEARALLAQFRVEAALHNAEQRLLRSMLLLCRQRPLGPAMRRLHRRARLLCGAGVANADIQRQDDIGPQFGLNTHNAFGR